MKSYRSAGFTIIELLVVIVVIAILVALTLPNLFSLQGRARDDQRKNHLHNLKNALESYFNDNEAYPAELAPLVPDYHNAIPVDPQGGTYTYTPAPAGCTTAANNCSTWTLSANLENDKDPTAQGGLYILESTNQ